MTCGKQLGSCKNQIFAKSSYDDHQQSLCLKSLLLLLFQVTKAYNYIHKYGHKSKLMAAAVRNKQDLFSLLGYSKTSFKSDPI